MKDAGNIATWVLATSQLALAGALIWFGLALWWTARDLPAVAASVERSVDKLQPLVAEVAAVRRQIPPVLAEVKAVREQVPAVLAEVKAVRGELPALLGTINAVVKESTAIRATLPEILAEVRKTRAALPPLLERAEHIMGEARNIGREATQGVVTGTITGIIRAPFALVGSIGRALVGNEASAKLGLTESDYTTIETVSQELLARPGTKVQSWRNPVSGHAGEVRILSRWQEPDRTCVKLRIDVLRDGKRIPGEGKTLCTDPQGQWQLRPEEEEPGD